MSVETERIAPADVSDEQNIQDENQEWDIKKNTTIFDSEKEGMTDCLAVPKRNNMRKLSDGFKVTASGALESGRDGIKKAASGLSSGIKNVTNRIPLPKSPKALRRRSWHAYDELEEHIYEQEPEDDKDSEEGNTSKKMGGSKEKVKKEKSKTDTSKEKTKKNKNKGKKNGKNSSTTEAKIDWCSIDGGDEAAQQSDKDNEIESDAKEDTSVLFESLESVDLISKVTINVHETD